MISTIPLCFGNKIAHLLITVKMYKTNNVCKSELSN